LIPGVLRSPLLLHATPSITDGPAWAGRYRTLLEDLLRRHAADGSCTATSPDGKTPVTVSRVEPTT
jgi:hypothetical protein